MTYKRQYILLIVSFVVAISLVAGAIWIYHTSSIDSASKVVDNIVQVDIIYAYLKVYKVSDNVSALGGSNLVSYAFVLNVSNPTVSEFHPDYVKMVLSEKATQNGTGVKIENPIVSYANGVNDKSASYLYPESSDLFIFSATGEISNTLFEALKTGTGYFTLMIEGVSPSDQSMGSAGFIVKQATIEAISDSEFVYNTYFSDGQGFSFNNDNLKIIKEGW